MNGSDSPGRDKLRNRQAADEHAVLDLLALDLGNKRLKALGGDPGAERALLPASAGPDLWERELAALLTPGRPVALCSVNPPREAALVAWLAARGHRVWAPSGESPVPFRVEIRGRETLGPDRLCNAAAAWAEGLAPALLADAGTALTLDVVDKAGSYLGGLILPGPSLMLGALARGTARLPRVEPSWDTPLIGKDTREALAAGASWGLLAALEGLVARLRESLGARCPLVVTGGAAPELVRRWRGGDCRLEPDWTLRGLIAWFRAAHEGGQ